MASIDWNEISNVVTSYWEQTGVWLSYEEILRLQAQAPEPAPSFPPITTTIGSGKDTLTIRLSQDAYHGNAQYVVRVDGVQVGGTFEASALHSSGQSDTLTIAGDWGRGAHTVTVVFLNDDWGGSDDADRNLYVESIAYNGKAAMENPTTLAGNGSAWFTFVESASDSGDEFGQMIFAEEFNGSSLDRSVWPVIYGGSTYWTGAFRWENSEVSVSDGNLVIGLDKGWDGVWSVGGISSAPTAYAPGFAFQYGKVEIRAKASQEVTGAGPCFLLWPIDGGWPPEVDILETPKGQGMFTSHWPGPQGENYYESTLFDIDYSRWHVYGLEWTPERLTMTVDGRVIKTLTTNIPNEPLSIGFQGHVGASWEEWYGGSPNGSGVNSVDIYVDYVRVYDWVG